MMGIEAKSLQGVYLPGIAMSLAVQGYGTGMMQAGALSCGTRSGAEAFLG
jgi:hypothetical protein